MMTICPHCGKEISSQPLPVNPAAAANLPIVIWNQTINAAAGAQTPPIIYYWPR